MEKKAVEILDYNGVDILYFDGRGCTEAELLTLITKAKRKLLQGNQPYRVLSNVTGNYATPSIMQKINELRLLKHRIHKEAVVGINGGAKRVLFNMYNRLIGGKARAFDHEEMAKEWLISDIHHEDS